MASAELASISRPTIFFGERRALAPQRRRARIARWGSARAAGVEALVENRVLVSCCVAAGLGQIAKPFTYALFGKGFNVRLALTPGGMPSTHSATVTAAATALGLDRGLGDSLFGVAVILAALVMYDAQGVRRSVGKQAEVINTLVLALLDDSSPPQSTAKADGETTVAALSAKRTAVVGDERSAPSGSGFRPNGSSRLPGILTEGTVKMAKGLLERAERLPSVKEGEVNVQEFGSTDGWRHIPLKESVGHTKVEVLVGALWGIVVAFGVHWGI